MVPYLIGKNTKLSGRDARSISTQMMNGNKWRAFILDMSFIGWALLSVVTFGISNLIWTDPYAAATDAELYLALRDNTNADGTEQHAEEKDITDNTSVDAVLSDASNMERIVNYEEKK